MTRTPSQRRGADGTSREIDARAERHRAMRRAIPEHLDRLTWSAERVADYQQDRLRELLGVAKTGSAFHADRLAGIDAATFGLDQLHTLPTMTKREMMSRYDDVVTDHRFTREVVENHLARTTTEAAELFGEHLVLASGGSSGERGVFVYSRAAAVNFLLSLLRPGLARTVAMLGDLPSEPGSVATVAAGSGVHATRAFASLFGGALTHVTSIDATEPLPKIVERLEALQPLLLQGYPSVIRRLVDEKLAGRLSITPMSVTTTSEPLTADARGRIDEAFGVGVCNMFGSSEGVLGVSPPDDDVIVLASDYTIVELVDEDDQPVAPGTASAKVLVTNLANLVQPLIRYELTDSFVRHAGGEDGHLRVSVEGRRDDELRYADGVVVHPLAIRTVLVKASEVVEYQVRQTPRGVDVAVVAEDSLDTDRIERALVDQLSNTGLSDPVVTVCPVDASAIERHPATGKTRRFIPLDR